MAFSSGSTATIQDAQEGEKLFGMGDLIPAGQGISIQVNTTMF